MDVVGEGVLSAGEEWGPEPGGLWTFGAKEAAEVSVEEGQPVSIAVPGANLGKLWGERVAMAWAAYVC